MSINLKMHFYTIKCIVFIAFIFLLPHRLMAIPKEVDTTIMLSTLFSPNTDLENGIIGNVQSGGRIDIQIYDADSETLVYRIFTEHTTTTYSGEGMSYGKTSLGSGAKYYPNFWLSNDFKTSFFAIDRLRADKATTYPYSLMQKKMNLKIFLTITNATLIGFKFPGIGIIDKNGGNSMFHPNHYCYNLAHNDEFVTQAWKSLKSPNINRGSDLAIACHRGIWGDNLGAGNPENSTASIEATKAVTDYLESDIMITNDKELVVIHDYNLHRVTNYSGPDRNYLFNMKWDQLKNLLLRRRNMTVSQFKLLRFGDLVDLLVQNKLVLQVDIKDIRARYNAAGQCVDNCEYDPKTHGEEASKKIKDSWMEILKKCIEVAKSKNALQYISFKVPHSYNDLKAYVPDSILSQVLFMPVIQPGRADYLEFTDGWINDGGPRVIAYETNFKSKDDNYLKPFTRGGKSYQNFLHYVYERTKLRPGCYPEEPMGPKGIVNRWADWLAKDLRGDVRGDHYFLMDIPYGKIMILTTDRPDIWKIVEGIYNSKTDNH